MPRVEIVQKHNTAARRLYIRGHNGKIYPYLVMNDACLTESRREERVLQLLRLLNPCLEKRKETTKRHLFFTGMTRMEDLFIIFSSIIPKLFPSLTLLNISVVGLDLVFTLWYNIVYLPGEYLRFLYHWYRWSYYALSLFLFSWAPLDSILLCPCLFPTFFPCPPSMSPVPRVVAVSPQMRLVEDNPSSLSLVEIYKQRCAKKGIEHDNPISRYYDRLATVQARGTQASHQVWDQWWSRSALCAYLRLL